MGDIGAAPTGGCAGLDPSEGEVWMGGSWMGVVCVDLSKGEEVSSGVWVDAVENRTLLCTEPFY